MPKIVGVKLHEYHIEANNGFPARDFSGFKFFIGFPMAEEDGYGDMVMEFNIASSEVPTKIPGFSVPEVPHLVGEECSVDLAPVKDGKFKLVRIRFVK